MTADLEPADTATSRRDRIVRLLDAYPLLFTTVSRAESAGAADGVSLLPAITDHPSVRELMNALARLEEHAPTHYRHLKAYYGAEKRQVKAKLRVRGPHGKLVTIDGWKMERLTPKWVRQQRVRLAVSFVVAVFRGEVYVPAEMLAAA